MKIDLTKILLWLFIVIICLMGILWSFRCNAAPETSIKTRETTVSETRGAPDTTVIKRNYTGYTLRKKEPVIVYKAIDDTAKLTVRVQDGGDSVKIDYDLDVPEIHTYRTDTLKMVTIESVVNNDSISDYAVYGALGAILILLIIILSRI